MRLWIRVRKNKESATFEYDVGWLKHPAKFSLEPALQLGPGPFHTPADTPMFRALGDSAPDRWGRALMRRMERRRERNEREEGLRARPLLSMRICSSQDRADTDGMNSRQAHIKIAEDELRGSSPTVLEPSCTKTVPKPCVIAPSGHNSHCRTGTCPRALRSSVCDLALQIQFAK